MWDRVELKTKAKEVLKKKYWKSFLISLVLLLSGADSRGGGSSGGRSAGERMGDWSEWLDFSEYITIIIAAIILVIAFRILIGYSLEIGSRKYFIRSAQDKDEKGCYSFAFASENFSGIISTMLLRDIYTFLWALLLIIPGIIKSYAYRMVPYILADNPDLGADKAITLSRKMMDGNKFNLFVMELSFLGWYLLGILAFGIGFLFVNPYYNATEAQLYLVLRKTAIDLGYCTNEDLRLDDNNIRYDYYWEE
ncbi:MAG TPA: DUF975 family protein [Sedimentibacter sp.]|nr:DUF975 family protein [Sedimentibacter sp.]